MSCRHRNRLIPSAKATAALLWTAVAILTTQKNTDAFVVTPSSSLLTAKTSRMSIAQTRGPQEGRNRNENGNEDDLFDYFDPLLSPHAYPEGISRDKPPVDPTQQQRGKNRQQKPIQSHQASMGDSINIQGGNRVGMMSSDTTGNPINEQTKKKSFAFGSNRPEKKSKQQQAQAQANRNKVNKRVDKGVRSENDFNRQGAKADWQRNEGSRREQQGVPGQQVNQRASSEGWQRKEEESFRGAQHREGQRNVANDNRFRDSSSSSSKQQTVRGDDKGDWQRKEVGQEFRDDWQRNNVEGDFRQGARREAEPDMDNDMPRSRDRQQHDNQVTSRDGDEGDLFDYFDPLLSPHAYPGGISPEKPPVDITQHAQEHQQYHIAKEQGFAAAPFGFDLGNRDRKDEQSEPPSRPRSSRMDDEVNTRAPQPTNRAPPPPPRAPEPPPFFDPTLSPHLYSSGTPDVFIGDEGYDETTDPLQYENPEFSQRQERRRRRQERQRRRRVIGILLMDHGSRNQASNDRLHELADMYQQSSLLAPEESGTDDMVIVQAAHMEIASPSIEEGLHTLLQQGVESIVCHPFFLSPAGRHVAEDIPRLVDQAVEDLDIDIPVITTNPLGAQTQVMLAAIHSSIQTSEVFSEEEEYEQ